MRAQALSDETSRRIIAHALAMRVTAQRYAIVQARASDATRGHDTSNVKEALTMSVRAARIARMSRVNPAALAQRWGKWRVPVLVEFKKQTREQLYKLVHQPRLFRDRTVTREMYEALRGEVLVYMSRVKGDHATVRNVNYLDLGLVYRRSYCMATAILWRKYHHLERTIDKYIVAIRSRDPALILTLCNEVERIAQAIDYKDNARLLILHTSAEDALAS